MLKALLITNAQVRKKIQEALANKLEIVAVVSPDKFTSDLAQKHGADIIISDNAAIGELLQRKTPIAPRQHVKAITHQGIRLVPVENIFYFEAEHKYVITEHTGGQLLIEDSLNSLEQEFTGLFVRVHRKYLVARNKIETMQKNAQGQYFIKLRDREELLAVSRRQLPEVRKVLLCL